MVSEKRSPIPAKAGRRERFDYEYQRNGTRNLFMTCAPLAGWRHVAVTKRRTMTDFAHQMRWLADAAYPEAEKIRVVLDNLNTHRPASLTRLPVRGLRAQGGQTGDPRAGVSLYSPAWELAQSCPELAEGMAEIEFSVFSNQCLNRRIEDEAALQTRDCRLGDRAESGCGNHRLEILHHQCPA